MAEAYLSGILWRDTARSVRFFIFDARVLWGLMLWALHMSWITFYIAAFFMVLFTVIEFFGMRPIPALRVFKNFWKDGMRLINRRFYLYRRVHRW